MTFFRNPLGVVGLFIVVMLIVVAAFAPWIATHDPYLPNLSARLAAPNAEYWFGADELGRDIYSRLVNGSRLTLLVGIVFVLLNMLSDVLYAALDPRSRSFAK